MNKTGRPPRPEQDRLKRRSESIKKARIKAKELAKTRKEKGLCRTCGEPVSNRSKIFCDKHLSDHRIHCSHRSTFSKLKTNARSRSLEFLFTEQEFKEWYECQPRACFYCGIEECLLVNHKRKKHRKLAIDRKNNHLGYSSDNGCLACFRCNAMKSNFFTCEEWKKVADEMIKPRLKEYHGLE